MKGGGFFAVQRDLFNHPMFAADAYSRREALIWLNGRAAWEPCIQRVARGRQVKLERGQVAVSERSLAAQWLWSKSSVRRYLRQLVDEGLAVFGPQSGPQSGPEVTREDNVLTLCNYDAIQPKKSAGSKNVDHKADQKSDHIPAQPVLFADEFGPNNLNNPNKALERKVDGKGEAVKRRATDKPAHGAKGRGMIWFDHGTHEWRLYAEDYKSVRGVERLPEHRAGGSGNWFKMSGEAALPEARRFAR